MATEMKAFRSSWHRFWTSRGSHVCQEAFRIRKWSWWGHQFTLLCSVLCPNWHFSKLVGCKVRLSYPNSQTNPGIFWCSWGLIVWVVVISRFKTVWSYPLRTRRSIMERVSVLGLHSICESNRLACKSLRLASNSINIAIFVHSIP